MKKVAVTDYSFDTLDVEEAILQPLGVSLVGQKSKSADEVAALVADADFVITQFAPVNAAVIGAMTKAKVIVRYGIGVDNVDLEAAKAKNIPVCNVPDYCIDEVADHTLAFILGLTRGVVANSNGVKGGKWGLAVTIPNMRKLADMTVGVIGFGRIGREVVKRLVAFKAKVLVFDPIAAPADIQKLGATAAKSIPELIAASDLVSPHCPSTAQTRKLLNRESIASMKPGSFIVNVGRGDLVDSAALVDALQSGHLAGAALDVYDPEPIPADSPVLKMPNVIVASHVASVSTRAVRALREGVAQTVAKAIRGEALPNIVNGVKA
jgi:D-3-phosphoglycerate dehydrogenase